MTIAARLLIGCFVLATNAFGAEEPSNLVRIVSPAAGTTFLHGEPIAVRVVLSPPFIAGNTVMVGFIGMGQIKAKWVDGMTYIATLPTSLLAQGKLVIVPTVVDTSGWPTSGAPVVVGVLPAAPLKSIDVQMQTYFEMPDAQPRQLYVRGELPDGNSFDVTDGITGTTYAASDPAVLDVSADGLVTIRAPGRAYITVRHGSLTDVAAFLVEDRTTNPLPPANLTSKVAFLRSEIGFDPKSSLHVQDVIIRNVSGTPLTGPLYVVVRNLRPGVKLAETSGLTKRVVPTGSPYRRVDLTEGDALTLAGGESAKLRLRFLTRDPALIDYSLELYAASTDP